MQHASCHLQAVTLLLPCAFLCRCIQLTDEGMVPLAEACHRLELLSLHGIQGVTDRRVSRCAAMEGLHLLYMLRGLSMLVSWQHWRRRESVT